MKKRDLLIKGLSLLILLFALLQPLSAQKKLFGLMTYDMSFPFGNTKEFSVAGFSWRGISGQFRYFLKPKLSAGLYFGLQVFHGDTMQTADINLKDKIPGAITGTQFRYINSIPIMLGINYHAGKDTGTQVFFGLNAGVFAVEEKVDVGIFSVDQFVWHFGLAPEIGVITPIGYNLSLTASVKYSYAFSAGPPLAGQSSNQSYLSLSIGLGYTYYFFPPF